MQKNKAHILSTASLPQTLIDLGEENDVTIDAIPFIDISPAIREEEEKKITDFFSKKITAVFTSSHAAKIIIEKLQGIKPFWSIYCTAGATKKTLKEYFGESGIAGSGPNAVTIAGKIKRDEVKEVIFFCGDQRMGDLTHELIQSGIAVHEAVVYQTILSPRRVNKNYGGILFFSPSAVKSFFSVNDLGRDAILFAIGATTASAIKKYAENKIIISESPGKDILTKLAIGYFKKHSVSG